MDYDKDAAVLRIRGKNILENDHVKVDCDADLYHIDFYFFLICAEPCVVSQIGAFHTLEIELKRPFVLRKVDALSFFTNLIRKKFSSTSSL